MKCETCGQETLQEVVLANCPTCGKHNNPNPFLEEQKKCPYTWKERIVCNLASAVVIVGTISVVACVEVQGVVPDWLAVVGAIACIFGFISWRD